MRRCFFMALHDPFMVKILSSNVLS
jgi:hypothetical protein